jgi:hypothetical protein
MAWQDITGLPKNKRGEGADPRKVPHYARRTYERMKGIPSHKEKRRLRAAEWRRKNPEKAAAINKRSKEKYRDKILQRQRDERARHKVVRDAFFAEHKRGGCIVCGEADPRCLDFHHRDPATKLKCVAKMMSTTRNWAAVLEEIKKCDVLCANCHRKHHRPAMKGDA